MQHKREAITVHSHELCVKLLGRAPGEDQHHEPALEKLIPTSSSPQRQHLSSPTRAPSRSSTAQMTRIDDWLSRKARRSVISLPEDPELTKLQDLCQMITDKELEFLSELDTFLLAQQEVQRCKSEVLYKKWCERVFDPLRHKLSVRMTGDDYVCVDRSKRELFDQYLLYRNKRNVYLDTISAEEYDPMKQGSGLKVCTGSLDDPLISQRTEFAKEQLVLRGCDQGIPLPDDILHPAADSGREDTDCVLWLAMHLIHIDSAARERSRNHRSGLRNELSVDSDAEWENRAGEDLFKKEQNIPHKRPIFYPRQPIVLHMCEQSPHPL